MKDQLALGVVVFMSSVSDLKCMPRWWKLSSMLARSRKLRAKSVELPRGERVAGFEFLQATEKGRALSRGS